MTNTKVIVLAELPVFPQYLKEIKALSAKSLIPTLKEAGCEAFYQTYKIGAPDTLVFFEVFKSKKALDIHMNAEHTKKFFEGIKGKLSAMPVSTVLSEI
ncbi:putative quinol monooxygenase [Pedobacter miscanthi]|uniref:ABM domain-containing protein n=1 Tax=Pedobacter miscanthi TaxID=2259170 RepID=A0A366LE40_9SPHI|nr:putative quinol monooxygenase [Pedobacter miscanthi]RBQ11769.1 hypothetical protein DRW42_00375 [Pedobacter miscanthi]